MKKALLYKWRWVAERFEYMEECLPVYIIEKVVLHICSMKTDVYLPADGFIVGVHGIMPEKPEEFIPENGISVEEDTYSTATVNGLNN